MFMTWIKKELPSLSEVRIPRFINIRYVKEVQPIEFPDASQKR